ncbi:MAG: ribosome-associated translation inhibitor RaiA [Deltaproteobacteria bacterium]|nr:ribosome-associated translation inhibitor RaiA [Deltaproteobacteria bacterium]MBW2253680.1 ribosome-associated translation inhibitor RaiA [Deltaproteobacteria bacterium]
MHLEVTFRNLAPREEVRQRADVLFSKLQRFLDPAAEGQLNIQVEHNVGRFELVLTTRGTVYKAAEEDEDLRTAMDRLFHRMEMQLRRAKERRIHKNRRQQSEGELAAANASEYDDDDDENIAEM